MNFSLDDPTFAYLYGEASAAPGLPAACDEDWLQSEARLEQATAALVLDDQGHTVLPAPVPHDIFAGTGFEAADFASAGSDDLAAVPLFGDVHVDPFLDSLFDEPLGSPVAAAAALAPSSPASPLSGSAESVLPSTATVAPALVDLSWLLDPVFPAQPTDDGMTPLPAARSSAQRLVGTRASVAHHAPMRPTRASSSAVSAAAERRRQRRLAASPVCTVVDSLLSAPSVAEPLAVSAAEAPAVNRWAVVDAGAAAAAASSRVAAVDIYGSDSDRDDDDNFDDADDDSHASSCSFSSHSSSASGRRRGAVPLEELACPASITPPADGSVLLPRAALLKLAPADMVTYVRWIRATRQLSASVTKQLDEQLRLVRNRHAAQDTRNRKKQCIQRLEEQVQLLEAEGASLASTLAAAESARAQALAERKKLQAMVEQSPILASLWEQLHELVPATLAQSSNSRGSSPRRQHPSRPCHLEAAASAAHGPLPLSLRESLGASGSF